MDQIKIGEFIMEARKERGLTQKQLGELVGVSDKTISKWECGRGMPELSAIMPVCEALHMNVNELLSGERISGNDYQGKAEENMMNLMKETEESRKKNRAFVVIPLMAVVLAVIYLFVVSMGIRVEEIENFLDVPVILIMIVTTILFLMGTGLGKAFLGAFRIAVDKRNLYAEEEVNKACAAVKLAGKTWLITGALSSLVGIMSITYLRWTVSLSAEAILRNIFVALLGLMYGILGYLLLLPVKTLLQTKNI